VNSLCSDRKNKVLVNLYPFFLDSQEQISYAPIEKNEAYPPVDIRNGKDSKESGLYLHIRLQTGLQVGPQELDKMAIFGWELSINLRNHLNKRE
jgi:hypothetical protein